MMTLCDLVLTCSFIRIEPAGMPLLAVRVDSPGGKVCYFLLEFWSSPPLLVRTGYMLPDVPSASLTCSGADC
jgi:hypothetical protein